MGKIKKNFSSKFPPINYFDLEMFYPQNPMSEKIEIQGLFHSNEIFLRNFPFSTKVSLFFLS